MDFFKPEDFVFSVHPEIVSNKWDQLTAAALANAKLLKEAKVVYGPGTDSTCWDLKEMFYVTHKALLINIEKIKTCTHPTEKVDLLLKSGGGFFKCECGVQVKVKRDGFEEV